MEIKSQQIKEEIIKKIDDKKTRYILIHNLSGIFVEANVAYLTSRGEEGGIALVDVNDPQDPKQLLRGTVAEAIQDIQVQNGMLI
ncbi:MAG: hypothetical protein FK734_05020 [Asgard group archaeon]|nr:hypothetical protein [Asgard group archaeon]